MKSSNLTMKLSLKPAPFDLGAELATGTCTLGSVYLITATQVDHFFAGCAVGDFFTSDGTEILDANNKVKEVNP